MKHALLNLIADNAIYIFIVLVAFPLQGYYQACDNITDGGSVGGNGLDTFQTDYCYQHTFGPPIFPSRDTIRLWKVEGSTIITGRLVCLILLMKKR